MERFDEHTYLTVIIVRTATTMSTIILPILSYKTRKKVFVIHAIIHKVFPYYHILRTDVEVL